MSGLMDFLEEPGKGGKGKTRENWENTGKTTKNPRGLFPC